MEDPRVGYSGFFFDSDAAQIVSSSEIAHGRIEKPYNFEWLAMGVLALCVFVIFSRDMPNLLRLSNEPRVKAVRMTWSPWVLKLGASLLGALLVAMVGFRRSGDAFTFERNFGLLDFVGLAAIIYAAISLLEALYLERARARD